MVDQADSVGTEFRGEHAVERGRIAPALQMAEHDGAHLSAQPLRHLIGHDLANAPELHLPPFPVAAGVYQADIRQAGPLGHHDEREFFPFRFSLKHLAADIFKRP